MSKWPLDLLHSSMWNVLCVEIVEVERECVDLCIMLMVDICWDKFIRILLEFDNGDESSYTGITDALSTSATESLFQKTSVEPLCKQLHDMSIFPRASTKEYAPTSKNDSILFTESNVLQLVPTTKDHLLQRENAALNRKWQFDPSGTACQLTLRWNQDWNSNFVWYTEFIPVLLLRDTLAESSQCCSINSILSAIRVVGPLVGPTLLNYQLRSKTV